MYKQIPIGKKLYLYTNKAEPSKDRYDLAIVSHGGYVAKPNRGQKVAPPESLPTPAELMQVPSGTSLNFYCPENQVLAYAWRELVTRKIKRVGNPVHGKTIPNYRLSKFEIAKREDVRALEDEVASEGLPRPMDILTVRNRWWADHVTLNDALSELASAGYKYKSIHCGFCRSREDDPNPEEYLNATNATRRNEKQLRNRQRGMTLQR